MIASADGQAAIPIQDEQGGLGARFRFRSVAAAAPRRKVAARYVRPALNKV